MKRKFGKDGDIARFASGLEHKTNVSTDETISSLIKKRLQAEAINSATKSREDLPTFLVHEDSPPISLENVKRDSDQA